MKQTLITVLSSKSVVTSTLVVSVSVGTVGSILARIGRTFVNICKHLKQLNCWSFINFRNRIRLAFIPPCSLFQTGHLDKVQDNVIGRKRILSSETRNA